jgi:hypothetical protein
VSAWVEEARRVPVATVAEALGLDVAPNRKTFGPCPECGATHRGRSGTGKPRRCRVVPSGTGWVCTADGSAGGCGAKGDGLRLAALALTGGDWASGDAATASVLREWYASHGWVEPDDDAAPVPTRPTHPRLAPPIPPRPLAIARPEFAGALWFACRNVDEDPECAAYLDGRGFDPRQLHDLVRALPPGEPLPGWAASRGGNWNETGHRLIVATWEPDPRRPGKVRFASLHARCVRPCEPSDKARSPRGYESAGLLFAVDDDPLREGEARRLVTLTEGVPDWLAWAVRPASERGALLGTWEGSAQPSTAALVQKGWTAALAHHADRGGDGMADAWRRELEPRGVRCVRCRPTEARGKAA